MKRINKKMIILTTAVVLVGLLACGGVALAYSEIQQNIYDNENFIYDVQAKKNITLELPAKQSVEALREPVLFSLFKRNEERELRYDGSWCGNGVQNNQYVDDNGGTYMFNAETGQLGSMTFTFTNEETNATPPADITKEEIVALAKQYFKLYLPYADQYVLQEWQDFTEEDEGEYKANAYSVRFAVPVVRNWFFEAGASMVADSCGRMESLILPNDNTYAAMTSEERAAIAQKLPTDEQWYERVDQYMKERYGEGKYEIVEDDYQVITKEDDGYRLTAVWEARIGQGDNRYATQVVYEEMMN